MLFTGLLAAILDLDSLVEMLSIGTLLAYTIVVICVMVLRYRVVPPKRNSNYVKVKSENVSFSPVDDSVILLTDESEGIIL